MADYIAIDGGTTNTRLALLREGKVAHVRRLSLGARSEKEAYKAALRREIAGLLLEGGIGEEQVECILASGMITSEYGLCQIPHLPLPAGGRELHERMHRVVLEEISPIPFFFIPGLKSQGKLEEADVMRGEETEVLGLWQGGEDILYVLPGTHSKHITLDPAGQVRQFCTLMTGELFAAVSGYTVLKDALSLEEEARKEDLGRGAAYAKTHGINEALFKTRVLKNLLGASGQEAYGFLLGAVLSAEVEAILAAPQSTVVIGGQGQMRRALGQLLQGKGKTLRLLSDQEVAESVFLGACRIYEWGRIG